MIKIQETGKRSYIIKNGNREIIPLSLFFSPIANKFHQIINTIEDMSKELGDIFDEWFEKYIIDYVESEYDTTILKENIFTLKTLSDEYLEKKNVNFNNYIQKDKVSKNSIFFDAEELENMIKVSNYLKLFFIISQDVKMKPPPPIYKEIYNSLINPLLSRETMYKLYKLVSSKTHKYNISDKVMWEFIKVVHCKPTEMHVTNIFNFVINNILVTCETESNPIPYFSSVIDASIKWILGGVYKESIRYSDTINTEDIHTISGKDNLLSYTYNDTFGRLIEIATKYLEEVGITDIPKFNAIASQLKETSLLSMYVSFPILSNIFDIPYRYLRPIQIEHSYLLNILVYYFLPKELKDKFPIMTNLLLYYNSQKCILKTTYRIKNSKLFFETFDNFCSFKNMVFASDLYSDYIGKLARNDYYSFINEKKIANFPLAKLENDMIVFYNMFFSGQLSSVFEKMKNKIKEQL